MNAWLYDVLKNGSLQDNQIYVAERGLLKNRRWAEDVELSQSGRWMQIKHDTNKIWRFLVQITRDVSDALQKRPAESLVLFNAGEYEHNTDDDFIDVHGIDARNFRLTTGNVIGYVRHGDYGLKVSSRFGDAFLRYIIADADGFLELAEFGGEHPAGDYDWLLAYLWMIKLKHAFRLGLPKTYVGKTEVTARVRGRLDPVRYFLDGQRAAYACSYREHSYANQQADLIARAYRLLKKHTLLHGVHSIASNFTVAAGGRRRTQRELLETRPFSNPFYADYNAVLELSKRVLRDASTDFGDQSETSAFFFDVSMLFEYFIRKLIKRSGAQLQSKNSKQWMIPTGGLAKPARRLLPDLLFEVDGNFCLFDVKYKAFNFREGVAREDLFQLHTYVGQCTNVHDLATCGFIYPISQNRWNHEGLAETDGIITDRFDAGGRTLPFHVLFIKIPSEGPRFGHEFKHSSDLFLERLHEIARRST